MLETLTHWDTELLLWFNYDGGTLLDQFWYTFSKKWTWIPAAIGVIWSLARLRVNWLEMLCRLLFIVLVIAVCDQISSGLIKPLVMRPRPSHTEELEGILHLVNNHRSGLYGFVSSHAANSMGFLVALCHFYRNRWVRLTLLVWALMTCYSRMYLGVHYPGDILCGAIVGVLSAQACFYYIYKPLMCKLQKRYWQDTPQATLLQPTERVPYEMMALLVLTVVIVIGKAIAAAI